MQKLRRILKTLLQKEVYYPHDIECQKETLGSAYGGWSVATNGLGPDSVVYSFGIGEDISFDLALISRYGMRVHAFDPTPRALQWVRSQGVPADKLSVHEFGLAGVDGTISLFPPSDPSHVSHSRMPQTGSAGPAIELPVRRLRTVMKSLNHERIDVLKMDIEGAEYEVISDLVESKIPVRQLLVEFHHRLPGVGLRKTKDAIELLRANGYKIFHVSDSGQEYSFISETADR